jgi:hypothetical protein
MTDNFSNPYFFTGHNEWEAVKVSYLLYHIAMTFIIPIMLYSIYWYEKYSSDIHFCSLPNILLSHTCLISIARSFIIRITSIIIILTGPYSYITCDIFTFFGRLFFLLFLHELAIWQGVRFLFICKGKKLWNLDDDFWAFYLTLCNTVLTTILALTTSITGYFLSEVDYHICTGIDPRITIEARCSKMPWYDNQIKSIFNFEYIIRKDPVGMLTRRVVLFILFFSAQAWIVSNKEKFKKFKQRICKQTPQEDLEAYPTSNQFFWFI